MRSRPEKAVMILRTIGARPGKTVVRSLRTIGARPEEVAAMILRTIGARPEEVAAMILRTIGALPEEVVVRILRTIGARHGKAVAVIPRTFEALPEEVVAVILGTIGARPEEAVIKILRTIGALPKEAVAMIPRTIEARPEEAVAMILRTIGALSEEAVVGILGTIGANAETVYRPKMVGKGRLDDGTKARESEKQTKLNDLYKSQFNKGVKQVRDREEKLAEFAEMIKEDFTRYADNEKMNTHLKDQLLEDDPMYQMKMNEKREADVRKGTAMPVYKGQWPPNRFSIPPGYRWDGVDRSNGCEAKLALQANRRKAEESEYYKMVAELD
ncbi:hypothetical protein QR680_017067 [Steinernema hermaphroditum]|uniref:BUD13 homolog n=1 Tax=Steinernema hermaphroditum TaxID=289476 RepID=A0AA39HD72_9BILA|nr:hypothetical protein QR680_017067 [Steinernema hermaphroditum]